MIGRILALDYGEKRVGLAMSDPMQMFAKPFDTIDNLSFEHIITELHRIIREQSIITLIIGIPWSIEGTPTGKTHETLQFIEKIKETLALPVIGWDERYTTSEANDLLKQMGYDWKKARKVVDSMAACFILKRYLESDKHDT